MSTKGKFKLDSSLILIIAILLGICLLLFLFFHLNNIISLRYKFAQDMFDIHHFHSDSTFSISKVYFFSSANASNNKNSEGAWLLDVDQFTDIAIYIDNSGSALTSKNTIKELSLNNFKFEPLPILGTGYMYYKNIYDFGKNTFSDSNVMPSELTYTIKESSSDVDFSKPEVSASLVNPITLGFVNKNIRTNYKVTDIENALVYDGSLLKRCNVSLDNISTTINFDINLTNQLDEAYVCHVSLQIPLHTENEDITSGHLILEQNNVIPFQRIR